MKMVELLDQVSGISGVDRWLEDCSDQDLDELLSDALTCKDATWGTLQEMVLAECKERNLYQRQY